MRITRHKFRLVIGTVICALGLILCFSPGRSFYRLTDAAAWLFIGGILCFVPEFHLRFSWFACVLALVMAVPGVCFTIAAIWNLFGSKPHGLLSFYEFVGIGPLLVTVGILAFDRKRAG